MAALASSPRVSSSLQLDFHNCICTLQLPQRPYSSDLHGAMNTLIHFRDLNQHARCAAIHAFRDLAHEIRRGPFLSPPASSMRQLGQLRLLAYGIGIDDWSITHNPTIVNYPWALTDHEFVNAYRYVYAGAEPDESAFSQLPMTNDQKWAAGYTDDLAQREALKLVESFLANYGGTAVGAMLRIKNMTGLSGIAIGIAVDVSKYIASRYVESPASALRIRYEVERVRRRIHA